MWAGLYILAVDPGVGGCFSLLNIATGAVEFFDMPVIRCIDREGRKSTLIDEERIASLIRSFATPNIACVVVERQQAFHKGSCSSAFKLAYGYGLIVGIVRATPALALRLEVVKPQIWKRDLGLVRAEDETTCQFKERSRQLGLRLFPGASDQLSRKKDENRAESLLIGEWARKNVLRKHIPGYRYRPFLRTKKSKVIAPMYGEAIPRASTV
jgi:hypothetical protein